MSAVGNLIHFFGETGGEVKARERDAEVKRKLLEEQNRLAMLRDAGLSGQRIAETKAASDIALEQALKVRDSDQLNREYTQAKADKEFKEALANRYINEGRYGSDMTPEMRKMVAMSDAQAELDNTVKTSRPLAEATSAENLLQRNQGGRPFMAGLGASSALADTSEAQARGATADTNKAVQEGIRYTAPLAARGKNLLDIATSAFGEKLNQDRMPYTADIAGHEGLRARAEAEKAANDALVEQSTTPADIADRVKANQLGVRANMGISSALANYPLMSPQLHTGLTLPGSTTIDPNIYRLPTSGLDFNAPSAGLRGQKSFAPGTGGNIQDLLEQYKKNARPTR